MSYLRFVAYERHGRRAFTNGPFSIAYADAKDTRIAIYYRRPLREHLDWFGDHLPVPSRFQRRLGRTSRGVGVCWFKKDAGLHISRMREMCAILDEIGHPMSCLWTAKPGLSIYQDDFQVVAIERKRPAHEC